LRAVFLNKSIWHKPYSTGVWNRKDRQGEFNSLYVVIITDNEWFSEIYE